MKILCSYSGIEFTCDHFPASLYARESSHPIFQIPQRKLITYLTKWGAGELTSIDSYLLFVAILKSSDQADFRVATLRSARTDQIVAQNMESLCSTILKLNTVTNPAVTFPRVAITPDTRTLENIPHWIANWNDSYEEFHSGKIRDYDDRKLAAKENTLSRLIKNPHKPISFYASQIADWASIAGSFPTGLVPSPFTGLQISLSDYWKDIIKRAASEDSLYSITRTDLEDLLEHCEINIPFGSVQSLALFKVLRAARDKQKNFLGLTSQDIARTTYTILAGDNTVEQGNLQVLIESAPDKLPILSDYPTKFAYLKAKLRWDMSKKQGNLPS